MEIVIKVLSDNKYKNGNDSPPRHGCSGETCSSLRSTVFHHWAPLAIFFWENVVPRIFAKTGRVRCENVRNRVRFMIKVGGVRTNFKPKLRLILGPIVGPISI